MKKAPANPERAFGVSVGVVLCLIAGALLWRGLVGRAEVLGAAGLVLITCGLLYPPILKGPSAIWWRFSRVLGSFNARLLLTLMFALVFVPLSLLWRLIGKDPLMRKRDRWPGWSPYPARYRDRRHYTRMF